MFGQQLEPQMNFDTHKSIKFLIEKGMKETQAESVVEVVNQSREHDFSKLATKDQLKILEERMNGKFAEVNGEFAKVNGEFAKVNGEFAKVNGEFAKVRGEIATLREEIATVREEIKSTEERLRGEIISAKHDILKWMIPLLGGVVLSVLGTLGTILTVILK